MKKLMKSTLFAATTLCAVIMLFSLTARAETTQCTPITTIPFTITTQGIYCLKGNLAGSLGSGEAITINTNNVTIDLNGYKLGNLAAGPGTSATGIYASQKKNITIRNGTIRGFQIGLYFSDAPPHTASSGHLVEDVRLDGNTYMGTFVKGTGNTIRNNQIVNTGGSTSLNTYYGIIVYGTGARVLNNDVINVGAATNGAYGIYIVDAYGTVLKGNRISDIFATTNSYGVNVSNSVGVVVEGTSINNVTSTSSTDIGIYLSTSPNTTVSDNRIGGVATYGIYYSGSATGIYMNNTVSGSTTAFVGGTAATGTNFSN